MIWSYGITTVPQRFRELLPKTLNSLALGGFDNPRLFVDGLGELPEYLDKYEVTQHIPNLRPFGNWILAAWELYARAPNAERYAIFQDDFVTYRNLRKYLEQCTYPVDGYWNLYTFPSNHKPEKGWYLSNQLGRGAVALVFDNKTLRTLLANQNTVDKPLDCSRGYRSIDGCVVTSMKIINYREYVHNPSLVQHTGLQSSMGNNQHLLAPTFISENFDALELLQCDATKQV